MGWWAFTFAAALVVGVLVRRGYVGGRAPDEPDPYE